MVVVYGEMQTNQRITLTSDNGSEEKKGRQISRLYIAVRQLVWKTRAAQPCYYKALPNVLFAVLLLRTKTQGNR